MIVGLPCPYPGCVGTLEYDVTLYADGPWPLESTVNYTYVTAQVVWPAKLQTAVVPAPCSVDPSHEVSAQEWTMLASDAVQRAVTAVAIPKGRLVVRQAVLVTRTPRAVKASAAPKEPSIS